MISIKVIDITIFIIANLVNCLMVAIFLTRAADMNKAEYVLGLILVLLALPVGAAICLNFIKNREWWTIVLPSFFILFCIVELLLDYILKFDFRHSSLLWPYLIVYYIALLGLIGYSFGMGKVYGFITLFTYFLNQAAIWYAHSR